MKSKILISDVLKSNFFCNLNYFEQERVKKYFALARFGFLPQPKVLGKDKKNIEYICFNDCDNCGEKCK